MRMEMRMWKCVSESVHSVDLFSCLLVCWLSVVGKERGERHLAFNQLFATNFTQPVTPNAT